MFNTSRYCTCLAAKVTSPACASVTRSLHSSPRARSHVGSSPVRLPEGVNLNLGATGVGSTASKAIARSKTWSVSGPKGTVDLAILPFVSLDLDESNKLASVRVTDPTDKRQRAAWGLSRALLANAIKGVHDGHTLDVRLVGVGYRASLEQDPAGPAGRQRLNLKLGFSHPVFVAIPAGINVSIPQPTLISLSGSDKQTVGQLAAVIRSFRKPEPYNGKGVFVGSETIRRKEVKKK